MRGYNWLDQQSGMSYLNLDIDVPYEDIYREALPFKELCENKDYFSDGEKVSEGWSSACIHGHGLNQILSRSIENKYLIETVELDKNKFENVFSDVSYLLESKLVPHVSYPYEWSFEQLNAAALHHLKFQLFLFDHNAVLRDATAYNIQFVGSEPIFIDILSIKEYEDGEYWLAYRQFCENFLNPLLLRVIKGIPHNNWFRGALEGIETVELNKLLGLRNKISWNFRT